MSDRPMRLKYLTKMKIILCVFLLYITAVSVFGEPQELNGILGESVKFPAAVKIEGSWMYSGVTIGDVTSGRFTPPRDGGYSRRLQWDSSTGLLSLFGLRLEDSGVYTVQDTHQNINTVFQLNVYIPVSKPNVIFHNESCTIECTAERGTEVTLSWYREGQTKPYVSSRVARAPHLHLTVERSGTYTCEAKNSVSNEKASITMGADCAALSVPVLKPHLSVTRNEYRCTVLCGAERGTGATLTLYKNGEKKPYVTSPVRSHPHLDMTVPVESGTYTCEAKNSVSSETSDPLTVGTHCTGGAAGIWQAEGSKMWSLCLVLIVMLCSRLV